MAAVVAPSAADMERAINPHDLTLHYDAERDTLVIHVGEPRPAISYDINGEVWIRFVPATREVVGIEIEDFQRHFLKQHPDIAAVWRESRRRHQSEAEGVLTPVLNFIKQILPPSPRQQSLSV